MPCPSNSLPDLTGCYIRNGCFHLQKIIGSGSFGEVYKALDLTAFYPTYYAIKCMQLPEAGSHQELLLENELQLHARVSRGDNVLKCLEHFYESSFVFIVLSYCPGGDLYSRIQKREIRFNDSLIRSIMLQIIDGLEYCHSKGVFHCDLKPENILTDKYGDIFLADFGLSTHHTISDAFRVGTECFMSPECLGQEYTGAYYSPELNDIWSLGVIMVNLITSHYPWKSPRSDDACFRAYLDDPDYLAKALPIAISPACNDILKRTLCIVPNRRLSLKTLRYAISRIETFYDPVIYGKPFSSADNDSESDSEEERIIPILQVSRVESSKILRLPRLAPNRMHVPTYGPNPRFFD